MATKGNITIETALARLRAGQSIAELTITGLDTTPLRMQDALLLAEHGVVVPSGNIRYDDADIAYDPEFDEVTWGDPVPFASQDPEPAETPVLYLRVYGETEWKPVPARLEWADPDRHKALFTLIDPANPEESGMFVLADWVDGQYRAEVGLSM
ncbi:MAG: hypothetical protein H6555_09270 [Lewinellaceae bacterium]|nr:hypothetical protein [Lewinellaceae bacterium]